MTLINCKGEAIRVSFPTWCFERLRSSSSEDQTAERDTYKIKIVDMGGRAYEHHSNSTTKRSAGNITGAKIVQYMEES